MAFIIYCGLFKATVIYFRFSNTPETFQAIMNDILDNLINKEYVIVYLDDILILEDNE